MSCYLKISHLNRHRKYRYFKDKLINFQQIRKELQVYQSEKPLVFILHTQHNGKSERQEFNQIVKMTEQQLCTHLKGLDIQEKQTIRIRVAEPASNIKQQESQKMQDSEVIQAPFDMVRGNIKSEELKMETANFTLRTEAIQVTQQFLCNSAIDRLQCSSSFKTEDIRLQLQNNLRRQRELMKNRKLKDISRIYSHMKRTIDSDISKMQ